MRSTGFNCNLKIKAAVTWLLRQQSIVVTWLVLWLMSRERPVISTKSRGSRVVLFWFRRWKGNGYSCCGESWYGFMLLFLRLIIVFVPRYETSDNNLNIMKTKIKRQIEIISGTDEHALILCHDTCMGPAATSSPATPPPITRPSGPDKDTLMPPDRLFVPPLSLGVNDPVRDSISKRPYNRTTKERIFEWGIIACF